MDTILNSLSGMRVVADGNLVYAYAEASGYPMSGIVNAFGVRRYEEPTTCKLAYRRKVFGYECSACSRITRSSGGEKWKYCPQCGAKVERREESD